MAKLVTASRFSNPDAAYVALVEARRGLSDAASADLDARLVLILANHLGDIGAIGNDAGFAFGLAQFSRLKEHLLRWFPLVDKPRTQPIKGRPDYDQLLKDPHVELLRGLAWCCGLREDAELVRKLEALGHKVAPRPVQQGDAHTIRVGPDGRYEGAADRRRSGWAAGY